MTGSPPWTKFEIQKSYQNKFKFNVIYSRNNLPKINNGTYAINLDQWKSSYWIALYVNANSFGIEQILKETKKLIDKKNITIIFYRIQANNSIMCGCFGIGFIDFVLKDKKSLDYISLFLLTSMKRMIK